MKGFKFAIVSIFLLALSDVLFAKSLNDYLDFYMGVDSQLRVTKFKKGFGENILKNTFPQGNIYVGFMLSDNVGVETGYESTTERVCHAALLDGSSCAGRHVPSALSPAVFKTKLRIKGPHIGLILFHPIKDYPIKLLGSVGISSIKGTAQIKGVRLGHPPVEGTVRALSKHKEALRFMGGAQYLIKDRFGFRATICFIKTRKVVIKKSDDHPAIQIPMIKLRDSVAYGLGAFYQF